jgi:TRAP transporter TAXI family solute receptor
MNQHKKVSSHFGLGAFVACAALALSGSHGFAQERLEILTLPTGSVAHGAASGIAGVVSQKTKLRILAAPYAGPQVVVPQVDQGKAAFTLINVDDTYRAFRGEAPQYKQAHRNLRLVSVGYLNTSAALVREDSGIRSVAELKGRRVAGVFSAHRTCAQLATAVLDNASVGWSDVRVVPVPSVVPGVQALGEGRADANPCGAINMGVIREVNARSPVRFLPINTDPSAVERARQHFVGLRVMNLKAGSADGVPVDMPVFVYDFYLLTHAGLSDDTVYTLVKSIWDNLPEIQKTHSALQTWERERMAGADVTAPYHPGAVKFFKEVGVWTPEMEAAREKLLKN